MPCFSLYKPFPLLVQADVYVRLDVLEGAGLLPIPPFQQLQVDAPTIYFAAARGSNDYLGPGIHYSSAASGDQCAGRLPSWQRITLRPVDIAVTGVSGKLLRQLLDSHTAEQLVIHGPCDVQLYDFTTTEDDQMLGDSDGVDSEDDQVMGDSDGVNSDADDFEEVWAMLRRRITS